ncbi:MAG: metallophosphoesterase [Armatimonadetes bacterium]|nr:metallophosphoesterase [Armatimonadota bacterium]
MRRQLKLGVGILLACLVLGCGSDNHDLGTAIRRFAVLSDIHVHNGSLLGTTGPEFQAYVAQDPKLIADSQAIFNVVIDDLKSRPLDFVLVAGDLTKDGERVNHELVAARLAELRAQGKRVYVVPGNHDINNPLSRNYTTTPASPTPTVSPAEFRQIYADCGYNGAVAVDPNSLSYVAEPVPGLWLFALDSCIYANNLAQPVSTIGGAFSAQTLAWINGLLAEARSRNLTVIGMMHHGLVEHFTGQTIQFPDFVVDNWQTVSNTLATNGLHVVFTGHYHANDVIRAGAGAGLLYDIETGSLVTSPSPYRLVDLDPQARTLSVSTRTVGSIPGHASDFPAYAWQSLQVGLTGAVAWQLTHAPYNLDAGTAGQVSPAVAEGMMAHYAGDESLSAASAPTQGLIAILVQSPSPSVKAIGQSLASAFTDLAPEDGTVVLDLPAAN